MTGTSRLKQIVFTKLFLQIDLIEGKVSTIAGTGIQGNDKEGGKMNTAQEISSPWDITVGPSPGQ